ncbi:hypothetical protein OAP42_00425 [Candidatus Marinimicrobia bacterium]|jgi:hypothetical protein|nr:hypothetical protein [Candidatus Neomarinimicrobiota bacterium]MDA8752988.1 hypothetical protein [Candidatus Neomarinimicrobiota bacterium]MDC0630540.1 hypothetical protein [Candidatus Neomarinimicrobiota bacterium]
MTFQQKVVLNNIQPLDVIRSFHNHNFVEFLISGQPVKINSWKGIDDNKKASFSFWFFGWRKMNVIHKNYHVSRDNLSFEDCGTDLPFGLLEWKHEHVVRPYGNGSIIEDNVTMDRSSFVKRVFIYPIMLFPIFIRRITYKIWFYFLEGKKWSSFKTS